MIYIDYSECFGCGACAEAYPSIFKIKDEKAWVILHDRIEKRLLDKIVLICPVRAITVERQD